MKTAEQNNATPSHLPLRRSVVWTTAAVLTAVAAATGISFSLHANNAVASAAPAAPQAIPVSVATVAESQVNAWSEFSGRLEAVERVDIRSRVSGAVQSVHFREGALVQKGNLLITIDPAPYAAEVERSQAQLTAAQARVSYTQSEHERAKRLWAEQAIAQRELDERVNALREAEANLRAAQATLQATKLNLDYTQVRAPVSGRVGKLEVTVGNLVASGPNAPVLTTLVSISPIYASFDADEGVIARAMKDVPSHNGVRALGNIPVQMGTSANVDTPIKGRLQLVDNQVDAKSGTLRVRAIFDNADGSLIPGQFARIRMGQPKAETAVLVNERAVGTDQDKKFVMVVGDDNTVAYREVTLGASVNGLRVVTKGLAAGDKLVVNGLQRVRPGALVAPEMVQMDGSKPAAASAEKLAKS